MYTDENYWKLIDTLLEKISFDNSVEDFFKDFNELDEAEQNLFAAYCCYSEVVNGGFYQFFTNHSGVLAIESVKGFQEIELSKCAEIISRATSFFGTLFPFEEEMHCETLDSFANKNPEKWNPFEKLDEEFYECLEIKASNFLFENKAENFAKKFYEGQL